MPHRRKEGLKVKLFKITNNFETYTTLERPSIAYIQHYTAHCLMVKKIPLSELIFKYEELEVFQSLTRVDKY